jgi:S-adenosylmethionine-diacylglycerol 3-amino-3-carboxypropyl transferase
MPTSASSTTAARLKSAVQHDRPNSRRGLWNRLFTRWFDDLVYNQIWEDPVVDAEALQLGPGKRVLCITSGGCNVLNYLVNDPEQVIAVDLNEAHMSLARLKLAAMRHLPTHDDFFQMFAIGKSKENVQRYDRYIRPHLDDTTRNYWDRRKRGRRRIDLFARGFYDSGRCGRFLRMLHRLGRFSPRRVERLLNAQSMDEQRTVFEKDVAPFFDTWLVRTLSKLPLSVFSLGIPPRQYEQLKNDGSDGIVSVFRDRVRRLACDFPIQTNYFAWQAFSRRYDTKKLQAIPDYLKPENWEAIRSRLDHVDTHICSTIDLLEASDSQTLDGFVLLDSQDWMPADTITSQWTRIARVARPGARVVFRTAGTDSPIEPSLPAELMAKFRREEEISQAGHARDRSGIYGMFHVYTFTG